MKQSKKMAVLSILEILKKYSDSEHRLTQREIQELLEDKYEIKLDRKSVRRNLMELVDYGCNLEYDIIPRRKKDGEEDEIATNWYLENELSDTELRLLIQNIEFSNYIPEKQGYDLINKLKGLSSNYFSFNSNVTRESHYENKAIKQFFYTIEVLNDAINNKRQVSFIYNYYDIDKQLHYKIGKDGSPVVYIINPIKVILVGGNQYLIGKDDKREEISNYRIDRITEIKMLDRAAKDIRDIKEYEKCLNVSKYMTSHMHMLSGDNVQVKFIVKRYQVKEVIDWLGNDVIFSNITDEEVTVSVNSNIKAFRYWALQFGRFVTVIKPPELVETLRADLKDMYERYTQVRI